MKQLGKDGSEWIAHDHTYVFDGENVVALARYTARNLEIRSRLGSDIRVRPDARLL